MKKKIALLSVCIFLLLSIFIRNIMIKSNEAKTVSAEPEETVSGEKTVEGIPRAEAFRLISYLYYTDEDREKLTSDLTYQDVSQEDWYYEYIVSLTCAGFENQADSANEKYYMRPTEELNQYEGNLLFTQIAESFGIDLQKIYQTSGLDLTSGTTVDSIDRAQFLALYETVLSMLNEKNALVHMEPLYLLAVNEDGTIITQNGIFYGAELFYLNPASIEETTSQKLEDYIDCRLEVAVSENRILYVKEVLDEATTFENAYIIHGEGNELTAYIDGVTKTFQLQAALNNTVDSIVGNITCQNNKVTGLSVKPDMVSDKVLLANDEYIELENYGKVEFDYNFKIYKVYGDLKMEQTNAILVGYANTQFVLTDHKISAALITEPISATNIRVMIKTDNYKSLFHDSVTFTCKKAFTIYYGEKSKSYKAKKEVTITGDSKYLADGRLKIVSEDGETPIKILSVNRSQGNPSYRGTIEIAITDQGLTIINELPIEEYLYAVIPSEMPVSYGMEALKTQAVCARSYAYKQLLGNNYSQYGAHVDDSSSYQVYNNIAETEESVQAVKATYGQVIEYQGSVITAYYFSTSCGYTSSMSDVWGGTIEDSYLVGSFQGLDGFSLAQEEGKESQTGEDEKEGTASNSDKENEESVAVMGNSSILVDFSDESEFRKFLEKNTYETLEDEFAWYRWTAELTYEDITENVNNKLKSRYEANPAYILTETTTNGEVTYEAKSIETVGEVTGIEVKERKSSGIITSLLIHGTKATILVRTEYNIRTLLAPTVAEVVRQDGSVVKKLSLLPSAFFVFDTTETGIQLTGGGYGHGVGMSQNGAKALADLGYQYEDIVTYYYKGTSLDNIYK